MRLAERLALFERQTWKMKRSSMLAAQRFRLYCRPFILLVFQPRSFFSGENFSREKKGRGGVLLTDNFPSKGAVRKLPNRSSSTSCLRLNREMDVPFLLCLFLNGFNLFFFLSRLREIIVSYKYCVVRIVARRWIDASHVWLHQKGHSSS